MRSKVLLMTAIGLVLLGAVLAVALNAVFTVTDVVVHFASVSDTGVGESYELQARLDEELVGRSTTFLNLEDVEKTVAEFPGFHLDKAEKDFPRTVVITVSERKEAMAFVRENGLYAVLDEEGLYLYDQEDNYNRRSGENILLQGFDLTTSAIGELPEGEYFEPALIFASVFMEELEDARVNIVSIALLKTESTLLGSHYLRIYMREGVFVDVYNPENYTREKAEAVLKKYLSLPDAKRLYGFFDVYDLREGGFTVSDQRAEIPLGDE